MSHHRNVGQTHIIRVGNKLLKIKKKLKNCGLEVTEQIKIILMKLQADYM